MSEIENAIKQDMGTSERGVCGDWQVLWKSQSRRTFEAARFAAENPGIDLEPYYRTTGSRPFRITKKTA
jgi:predicted phage-related endonuclease